MAAKFYTGKGDDGTTGLLGAGRVLKSDERIEALGCLDEATAALGFARSLAGNAEINTLVLRVQKELYQLLAEVAATPEAAETFHTLSDTNVEWLNIQTDALTARVAMPKEFILPGGTPCAGAFSLARTAVRRAERTLVRLHQNQPLAHADVLLAYLNRLSSLCFALEVFMTVNDAPDSLLSVKGH